METSSRHVQCEGCDQGDPMYEDITPHTKDGVGTVIELEENVAYSTTTKAKYWQS